ncbi:MAG: FG-GAP-like repeat-containing protein [Thermoplasmata archaeon]|nr:FG-GAP-like repeat-containing protein [Thermoplasmata archaeon]
MIALRPALALTVLLMVLAIAADVSVGQHVPQYQDASTGLPTKALWTAKTMFFDIDGDGDHEVVCLGARKGHSEPHMLAWAWSGMEWVNVTSTLGLASIGHSSYGGFSFADIDGDGDWDVGAGSHGADDVDAYLQVSPGSYVESSTGLDTAEDAWNIDFGDFNSDGNMDLLETGFWGMDVRPFAGSGVGTWLDSRDGLPNGHSRVDGYFCDLTNDGNLDIVASWGQGDWVYLGDGNGTWTNSSGGLPSGSVWFGAGIDCGDFNDDGFKDIVLSAGDQTRAFAGDGTGNWTEASAGLPSYAFSSIVLADMNNDMYDDVVGMVPSDPGVVELYLATGANTWVKAQTTSMQGNGGGWRVCVGDFDDNGFMDIAAGFGTDDVAGYPGSIRVWRETTPVDALDVTLLRPDGMERFWPGSTWFVVWTAKVPDASTGVEVDLELSNDGPGGPWSTVASGLPETGVYQWTVPDRDSDECFLRATISDDQGHSASDLSDGPFTIGVGGGGVPGTEIYLVPEPFWRSGPEDESYSVAWGDVDNDGDLDLAVGANGPNHVYENVDGNLSRDPIWESDDDADTEVTEEVMWGDIDGDGWLDLVAVNGAWGAGYDVVYLNHLGNLSTTANWTNENSDQSNGMDLGDYDGDGDLDLVTANYDGRECVYRNDDGTLTTTPVWQSYLFDDGTMDAVWIDVDGDGDLDAFFACSATTDSTDSNADTLYINDPDRWGAARFGLLPDWRANDELWTTCAKASDIDLDGDMDVIAANGFNNNDLVVMYENTGTALDADYTWSANIMGPVACDVADVNGDGFPDIAVSTYDSANPDPVYVILNDGGELDDQPAWESEDRRSSRRCAFGDMNLDGYPELAVANYGTSSLSGKDVVYLNRMVLHWVAILTPGSGENVTGRTIIGGMAGSNVNVTLSVEVSVDNGSTWHDAVGSALWTFEWDTRDLPNGTYTIIARATVGYLPFSHDEVTVEIVNAPNGPPTVTILEPDGYDDVADRTFVVSWNASDPDADPIVLDLYAMEPWDPATRRLIAADLSPTGDHTWSTRQVDEGHYLIILEASDGRGGTANDTGGPVEIDHPPALQVTTPGHAGIEADENVTVEWRSANASASATLDLWYDSDTDSSEGLSPIREDVPNDGAFLWDLRELEDGDYYVFAVLRDIRYDVGTYGPGPVEVRHAGAPENHRPSIVILEPNGTNDIANASYDIVWEAGDDDGDEVDIKLFYDEDGSPEDQEAIWEGDASPGRYRWDTSGVPEGKYYVVGEVRDERGATNRSCSPGTVTISHPQPGENVAPTVEVDRPRGGSMVKGTVTIRGYASDEDGNDDIVRVRVRIGDEPYGLADGTHTWSYLWDTTAVPDGDVAIRVRVEDHADAVGTEEIEVTVDNGATDLPPSIDISAPADGSVLAGDIVIAGTAADDVGVESVEVFVGGSWTAASGTHDWVYEWDTTTVQDGVHEIGARAMDGADHVTTVSISVTIDNFPDDPNGDPIVTFTDFPARLALGSSGWVAFTVSDPNGIDDIVAVFAEVLTSDGTLVMTFGNGTLDWSGGSVGTWLTTEVLTVGTYTFRVHVVDSHGSAAIGTRAFRVDPAPEDEADGLPLAAYVAAAALAAMALAAVVAIRARKARRDVAAFTVDTAPAASPLPIAAPVYAPATTPSSVNAAPGAPPAVPRTTPTILGQGAIGVPQAVPVAAIARPTGAGVDAAHAARIVIRQYGASGSTAISHAALGPAVEVVALPDAVEVVEDVVVVEEDRGTSR